VRFPSKLPFTSYLQYSPRGASEASRFSRTITYGIKRDSHLAIPDAAGIIHGVRITAEVVRRVADRLSEFQCLAECFSGPPVLVPIPRSAPLIQTDALWPTKRICEEMVQHGLGSDVAPILQRTKAIQRSTMAGIGQRPSPIDHYDSFTKESVFVLVDDVITRGATLIAAYTRLQEAFSDAEIRCFSLVRTESYGEIDTLRAPISGTINYDGENSLHRHP